MLGLKDSKKNTFSQRLLGVKGMFKKAYDDASKLNTEMQEVIDSTREEIKSLETKIGETSVIQKEAKEFMSNLEKFI